MKAKLLKKFRRYIKLSKKFEKSESKIFENIPVKSKNNINHITITSTGSNYNNAVYSTSSQEGYIEESRADEIINAAKENAELANEYDEYKQLQKNLTEFLNAENRL